MWNVSDYDLDAIPEPGPRTDPDFASLEPLVWMRLRAAEVVDPTEFVLNRVALSLARAPIVTPRTSDFVVFTFNEDFGEQLRENIEFAATREVVAELEAKGLLPARLEVPSEDEWPLHDEAAERRSSRDRSRTGHPPGP